MQAKNKLKKVGRPGGKQVCCSQMPKTVIDDHFPERIVVQFDDQTLVYRKRSWKIQEESTGELIEKGWRYFGGRYGTSSPSRAATKLSPR